jgi:streptogramin lyase
VDKNHMVWVSGLNTDRLFKFNPITEKWTEYQLPTRGTDIRFVSVDNRTDPVSVWLAYYQTSKMARVQFRTSGTSQTASR